MHHVYANGDKNSGGAEATQRSQRRDDDDHDSAAEESGMRAKAAVGKIKTQR